jgi:pimeloyl-ACP methyl ester carboxylesterase
MSEGRAARRPQPHRPQHHRPQHHRAEPHRPRSHRADRLKWALAASGLAVTLAACGATGTSSSAAPATSSKASVSSSAAPVTQTTVNVLTAPTHIAHTAAGTVGYRELGAGSPLLLITGFGASMDTWPPSFVDSLAGHHEVIVLDNAGVGQTAPAAASSIAAMADQTSDLISTLHLHRPAVLGWSMGGMIAQALAVDHPAQVSRLVLAATQAGTGRALPVPAKAAAQLANPNPLAVVAVLFPPDQTSAARAYVTGTLMYPSFYLATAATKASQGLAIRQWLVGRDPAGRQIGKLRIPTLVADGTLDQLDPAANDRLLAADVPGARLILYPDAGHAFLFQDASSFIPALERFLG